MRQRITNLFCGLSLTLSLDDGGLFDLLSLLDFVLGSFSLLSSNLLLLSGLSELRSEEEGSDGNIIQKNVEVLKSLQDTLLDLNGHLLSLP